MPKVIENNHIPEGCDAEKWITPDIFVYRGKLWEIRPDFKIVPVNELPEGKGGNADVPHHNG